MSAAHNHGISAAERSDLSTRAALASVGVAVLLLGLKGWASLETGSMAMLGSLADTALDLLASLVTLFGVRIAAQPADHDHRFGHGKAEALVAFVQIILISLSAIAIAWRSALKLAAGEAATDADLGIGVSLAAIAATLVLVAYQRRVVRRTGSVAIATDRLHYQSDLMLNGAVIAALALEQYAGLAGADAVFGLLIAGWLAWNAWHSSKQAIDQLMDKEWPDEKRSAFLAAAARYPELTGLHDLRTRTSGAYDFVQFHVWVPGDWTVADAHERMDHIEEELQEQFPGTEILIHLDPEGHTDRETMLPSALTEESPR